jgi:hypothetical protein
MMEANLIVLIFDSLGYLHLLTKLHKVTNFKHFDILVDCGGLNKYTNKANWSEQSAERILSTHIAVIV